MLAVCADFVALSALRHPLPFVCRPGMGEHDGSWDREALAESAAAEATGVAKGFPAPRKQSRHFKFADGTAGVRWAGVTISISC